MSRHKVVLFTEGTPDGHRGIFDFERLHETLRKEARKNTIGHSIPVTVRTPYDLSPGADPMMYAGNLYDICIEEIGANRCIVGVLQPTGPKQNDLYIDHHAEQVLKPLMFGYRQEQDRAIVDVIVHEQKMPKPHIYATKQQLLVADKPNRMTGTVVRSGKSLEAAIARANARGPIKGEFGASGLFEIDPTKVSHEITDMRAVEMPGGEVHVIGTVTFKGPQFEKALNAIHGNDSETAFSIRTVGRDGNVNSGSEVRDILAIDLAYRHFDEPQ